MHLKSLTVRGFKSFASATTFEFEPGVTAVVGPNGSGKSNVVDALAWVMGEQGAKTLRGGKMEDVIFAGTSGRGALGRAHVSLTIDNADGALPIDYAEVTISRTLFRAGGSEYAINGNSCRLLDIQELLSDSGLGREMHVIVGQGQLDRILHATPEDRRGFIEEAAGVLKHRRRKEKTVRKLDAMQGNLNRLEDLISEIRRQLTPLGKQAKVARRAQGVQFDLRDAKSRLMADDLVSIRAILEKEIADETTQREQQLMLSARVEENRTELARLEACAAHATPQLNKARDLWFGLTSTRERFRSLGAIAGERTRLLGVENQPMDQGRNPETMDAQVQTLREELEELEENLEMRRELLEEALLDRAEAEDAVRVEQERHTKELRLAADRREGLARLAGQVGAARSKVEGIEGELSRLRESLDGWSARRESTESEFSALEAENAGSPDDVQEVEGSYKQAISDHDAQGVAVGSLRKREQELIAALSSAQGRLEALKMSAARKDASADLLKSKPAGLLGRVSEFLTVKPGFEVAIAAALGSAAEALAVEHLDDALKIIDDLREQDGGRVHLVLGDAPQLVPQGEPVPHGIPAVNAISATNALHQTLVGMLIDTYIVSDIAEARKVLDAQPLAIAVTRAGDVLGANHSHGGKAAAPSLIEQNAAIAETESLHATTKRELDDLRQQLATAANKLSDAQSTASVALQRLNEYKAHKSSSSERLAHLRELLSQSQGERDRIEQQISAAREKLEMEQEKLEVLNERLDLANETTIEEPERDEESAQLAVAAASSRQRELDARLALRGAEERANALRNRIESLVRAAQAERKAREAAQRKAENRRRQATIARSVGSNVQRVISFMDISIELADRERDIMQAKREELEASLTAVRSTLEKANLELVAVTNSVHKEEMARAEQRLRLEALENRCIDELGMTADHLVENFGPHLPVPQTSEATDKWAQLKVEVDAEGAPIAEGVPFDRVVQEKRLKQAERDLSALGRVNPLALEEFAALEERHQFLATQLEDLKKSRKDLQEIIKEVDDRVERVFTEAYQETAAQFERVFTRLFPGGEGRLVLTEPGNMLTTGIEVEARPAGKKIKRLSLLSGGERSLTAVAFLVSIFKARPSPFYVMDEVEAALDDSNLGRLVTIFEELRESSQLIVITHQKRTMEVADALYGVTMQGDGVSKVISQRIKRNKGEA